MDIMLVVGDYPLHAHIDAGVEAGLRQTGHTVSRLCTSCLRLLGPRVLEGAKADLLLALRARKFPVAILKGAGGVRCKAAWLTEEPHDVDPSEAVGKHFDVVLTNDRNTCGVHGPHKTWHLPLAADPNVFRPGAVPTDRMTDVAFVGGIFPERKPLLEAAYHLTPDLRWRILGPQVRWMGDAAFAPAWERRRFSSAEAVVAYQSARIVLDNARDPLGPRMHSNRRHIPATGVGCRPFEATGCGRFLLTDDSRADIFDLFPKGSVGIYRAGDAVDLAAQIRYWLDREDEREDAAAEAHAWTLAHHTYAVRAKELADIVSAWLDTRLPAAPAPSPPKRTRAAVLMEKLRGRARIPAPAAPKGKKP